MYNVQMKYLFMGDKKMFCFFVYGLIDKDYKINEVKKMCMILKELHGKTPEYLLRKYGAVDQYPVDIVGIAKKIGIQLGSMDFSDFEKLKSVKPVVEEKGDILGFVRSKGDEVTIAYQNALYDNSKYEHLSEVDKKDKLIRRQRFTIAHEIAHCCLHMNPDKDSINIEYRTEQSDYTLNSREWQANIFAGELLVPLNLLSYFCALFGNNIPIPVLSDLFKVSNHVMKARLDYLSGEGFLQNIEYHW